MKPTTKYDYLEAVRNDVRNHIQYEMNISDWVGDAEGLEEHLNDVLWIDDSVTGNASGSYFCNAWKAEEALCHNLDLLAEAIQEFDCGYDILKDGPETCDVTIRCYLLALAISDVLQEYEKELEEAEEDE